MAGIEQNDAYTITSDGMHPESGMCFRYTDGKHNFYFYVRVSVTRDPLVITVIVMDATPRKFEGFFLSFESDDVDVFERNIRHYFSTVSIIGDAPPDPVPAVVFNWKVRR